MLGFVADERRMNVGLTRAKCSLFVLGNVSAIKTDKNWGALAESAKKRGCTLVVPARNEYHQFFSNNCQYPDSDLSGSEEESDDEGRYSVHDEMDKDKHFDDEVRDTSPPEKDRMTIDRAAETDGYAKHGFRDELVFEKASKADIVGGDEEGNIFADDDDANVDAFAEVVVRSAAGKKTTPAKTKQETEKKSKKRAEEKEATMKIPASKKARKR